MSASEDIELVTHVKDKTQPLTIRIPATLTPREIIEDLQAQNQVPRPQNRTVSMTHGKTNLQNDVPIGRQGVSDKDAVSIVWDGERLHGLNGSGRAPAALTPEVVQRAGHAEMPGIGWLTVTVPGAPA